MEVEAGAPAAEIVGGEAQNPIEIAPPVPMEEVPPPPAPVEMAPAVEVVDEADDSIIHRLIELAYELESHLSIDFLQYHKSKKLVAELVHLFMGLKLAAQQFHTQCKLRYQFNMALTDYKNLIEEAETKIAMLLQIRATFADLSIQTQKINESQYRSKEEEETMVVTAGISLD